jgi:signal transduction histidine kinase/DNA-binding response OmpR family regulator/CHASE3 domain sensor protein
MSTAGQAAGGRSFLSNLSIQAKLVLAYGAVLTMFVATCLMVFVNYQDLADARSWVRHTYTVILRFDELKQSVLQQRIDVVTATRDPAYLPHYQVAQQTFQRGFEDLKQLTIDNPSEQQRLDLVGVTMSGWYSAVAQPIIERTKAMEAGQPVPAAAPGASQYGYAQLERTIDLLQDGVQAELTLLQQRQSDVAGISSRLEVSLLLMLGLGLLIGATTILFTRRSISAPIVDLTGVMEQVTGGQAAVEVPHTGRQDEIGALARGLESFRALKHKTDAEAWVRQYLLDINAGLQTATTLDEFAEILLSSLCYLLHAGYGAFFAWDEAQQELFLRAGFGYGGQEELPTRFKSGQGLVGQCVRDGKPLRIAPVPETYLRIGSGLGEAPPRCLMIYPVQGRRILGVIELAAFELPNAEQERLLGELLRNAGVQLEAIVASDKTRALLAQSQAQTEELQASEEELRATNDALQDKNRLLEEQRRRLQESESALTAQAEELRATNEELEETGRILNESNLQLEQTRQALEQKGGEVARASQYKSEFLANMSHELRTPLNSILILAKSLADNEEGRLNADETESAKVIHDSGSHLLALINDILDLSKIEAGKMEAVAEDLAVPDILAVCERRFRPVAKQRGLALRVEQAEGLPPMLRSDGPKLQQILTNLLSNAFKFTEQGRVTLRLRRPDAAPPGAPELAPQGAVLFEVQDSGIGIPADKIERLFTAFEQADASTSRKYGGTGLGLAISLRMARLLGGDLQVESTPGVGSIFRLWLPERFEGPSAAPAPAPAAAPAVKAQPAAAAVAAIAAPAGGGAHAILVIEDDVGFAKVLAGMAQKRGFRTLLAHDAGTGLKLARQLPAAILLDIHLPDLDGWAVLQQLKADPATRHIPVHVVSAAEESARGYQLGAVGYLVKPVSKESINQALDQVQRTSARPARRLLLVGGDEALRVSLQELPGMKDANLRSESTGAAALERLQRESCDCLVLGLSLPDMDAFAFLERAAQGGPLPPVVVYAERELGEEELMKLRAHTDSIVVRGARSEERLLDEVGLFLHSLRTPAGRAAAVQAQTEAADLAGRTVLVVDDDMRNIFALSKVLRARGLNVLMAQDGPKALAQLEQRDGKVDAVLMDVMMPGMDGYETTRSIRSRAAWAQIPIIAVTAKAMPGDREKCLEAGANDYLSKPIDVDKLLSLLRTWIRA